MRLALVVLLAGCDFSALSADYAPWCPDGATFCDGFERGLGAWNWDSNPTGDAVVKLDTTSRDGAAALIATGSGKNEVTHSFSPVQTFALQLFVQGSAGLVLALDNGVAVTLADAGAWRCVEVVSDGSNATVFSDGTQLATQPVSGAASTLTLGLLDGGARLYDDVVLAPTRVGCP